MVHWFDTRTCKRVHCPLSTVQCSELILVPSFLHAVPTSPLSVLQEHGPMQSGMQADGRTGKERKGKERKDQLASNEKKDSAQCKENLRDASMLHG